jgi:uncharacterized protein (DUF4415 family)
MKRVSTSRSSRTDIKRLKSMKDTDVRIDDEAPAWTPEMFARAVARKGLKPVPKKTLLSLRVDSDVLTWFRAQGRGYQSRMNALLRAYVEAHHNDPRKAPSGQNLRQMRTGSRRTKRDTGRGKRPGEKHGDRWDAGAVTTVKRIRFAEIEREVPAKPGIYEIYTDTGIPLKVGVSANLRKRLLQHRASRQSGLRLKPLGQHHNPDHIKSKSSILAKHLYFDRTITADYDLTSESGRRMFLERNCYIRFEIRPSRSDARELEMRREVHGSYRYMRKVAIL